MRHLVRLVAVVVVLLLAVTTVWAGSWTGKVMSIDAKKQAFTLDRQGVKSELKIGPAPSTELKSRFGQLKIGDNVRVEVNEQQSLATMIEILPAK